MTNLYENEINELFDQDPSKMAPLSKEISSYIITTFLTHYRLFTSKVREERLRAGEYDWAAYLMDKVILRSPFALDFILELLLACENDEINYVAAGPLENFIFSNAVQTKEQLSNMVRLHPIMRDAIQGVWMSRKTQAGQILEEILKKYGLSTRGIQ